MLLLKKHGDLLQIRFKKKKTKKTGKEPGTWTKLAFLIITLKMSPK